MIAELRCGGCNKKLGENLEGRVEIVCSRCRQYTVFVSEYQSHKVITLEKQSVVK